MKALHHIFCDKKNQGALNIYLALFFVILFLQSQSQSRKDTLWATWKNTSKPDTVRLRAIGRLSSEFYLHSNPDSGIILNDLAYNFAKKRNLTRNMAVALSKKGGMYSQKGDVVNSLYYTKESLKLFRQVNYQVGIAACLNNLGQDYMVLHRNIEAVPCFYEALKIFEKSGEKLKEANTLSNIARSYEFSDRTDSAISVSKRCLKLCEILNDKRGKAEMFELLSGLHLELSQTDEAFNYEQKALVLQQELNDQRGLSASYYNLGKIYLNKGDHEKSDYYLEKSLSICRGRHDTIGISACFLTMSQLSKVKGNINEAIKQARKGLETIHYNHQPILTYELSYLLSDLYEQKKNYKDALAMKKLFIKERDSTSKLNSYNALYQEQLNYIFEKKEMLAKAENEKQLHLIKAEAERKDFRKNLWLTASVALLLILLLSSYFVYHHFRQKNIISSQKNNLLKQQLLVSQMNPHFIFNSLNAVQNFIFKQDSYQAGMYLKQFSDLIRMILDFSTKDVISLEDEFIFLNNYLELQKLRFNNKFNYELKIDPELEMAMVMIPPMLAQPFIENAIEHGIFYKNGEGFLSIKISLKKNTLLYEIEDNGIGLGESLKRKNKLDKKHKSLAIKITKERIETMNIQNHTDFEIEIKDKSLLQKESTGVYVKFATPYLTL